MDDPALLREMLAALRMNPLCVSVSVTSTDPDIIARAAETFQRAGLGLALEGVDVRIDIEQEETDEDAEVETD